MPNQTFVDTDNMILLEDLKNKPRTVLPRYKIQQWDSNPMRIRLCTF